MNDILGHHIKQGDTVIVARVSSRAELSVAIVLELIPAKNDGYKSLPAMVKIISTKHWDRHAVATKPGNTYPNRLCVIDKATDPLISKLTEAYNIYWETKKV